MNGELHSVSLDEYVVQQREQIQRLGEVIKAVQEFCQNQLAETGQCTCNGCQAHRAILKLIDQKLCSSTV